MSTGRSDQPVAVVTGAGSAAGIGFACARQLVEDGANSIAEERGSSALRPAASASGSR